MQWKLGDDLMSDLVRAMQAFGLSSVVGEMKENGAYSKWMHPCGCLVSHVFPEIRKCEPPIDAFA